MTSHLRKFKNQFDSDYQALKSELKYSYFEAFLTSFIVGIAESFFAAFAIEKGMSTIQSGLLLSLPLLLAMGLNLRFNFYIRKITVTEQVKRNVLLQIFSLLGLMIFALSPVLNSVLSFSILLCLFSIYWYGHFSSLPAWNLWISELLKAEKSTGYFTLRTRLVQIGIISGLVLSGALLQNEALLHISHSYVICLLFALALVGLFLKLYSYNNHTHSQHIISFSFPKMKKIFQQQKSFFTTFGIFNGSLFLSAPYLTGYLLISRELTYSQFMWITTCLFIGKISMSYLLNVKENLPAPIKLMTVGAFIAAPLPWLWPYCSSVKMMCLLNLTSGMAWALWEIGLSLVFFKNISTQNKIETVTLYNTIGIGTQLIGTCLGALLIKYVFDYNYTLVFTFAGIVRFLCVLPFQKNKNLVVNQDAHQLLNSNQKAS